MKNSITNLEIENFKSIKHTKMDCRRINVFIGEPNVGKSNILEALSLFAAPYSKANQPIFKENIRFEKYSNLFYDQDRKNNVKIITNIGVAQLRYHLDSRDSYDILIGNNEQVESFTRDTIEKSGTMNDMFAYFTKQNEVNKKFNIAAVIKPFYNFFRDGSSFVPENLGYDTPIKRYIFKAYSSTNSSFSQFLNPPFGENLYTILESLPNVYDEATHFFSKYGLDLLMDTEYYKLDVQKRIGNRVYKIPYSLAADTLQRIIFHIAAIKSNIDSILLLEEPEAHSFPPYISMLADNIIESQTNQFFIATHSPYLLTQFIENCSKSELAIFVCTYENYETKVKMLVDEEIQNIMETGIDLF